MLSVIPIAIPIVITDTHVAAVADFLELLTTLFGLVTALAVLANRLVQVLFSFLNLAATSIIPVASQGWEGGAGQQREPKQGSENRLSEDFIDHS